MAGSAKLQNDPIDLAFQMRRSTIDCRELNSLAHAAKRGWAQPEFLSTLEVQAICKALVIHLAQMGIGGLR
jgi:hypothetical protein